MGELFGAASFLSDSALTAAYLRRLGFPEAEAASLVSSRPLKNSNESAKALLSDLIRRHVLRIPFENLEQHAVPEPGGQAESQPVPTQERLRRLGDARQSVARVALGCGGGVCYDLNPPFAWVLRQLGATARLAAATVARSSTEYLPTATHVVVIVDFADGRQFIADPAFGDPPRTAVALEGESADALASYRVAPATEDAPQGFTKVLEGERGSTSLSRHVDDLDDSERDGSMATWTPVYAFRPDDDLAFDSEDLRKGLSEILEPVKTFFAQKRVICLGTPKGHVVLSERRLRCVEAGDVAQETPVESEEEWRRHATSLMGRALLTPPPADKERPRKTSGGSDGRPAVSPFGPTVTSVRGFSAQMDKAIDSQQQAAAKGKQYGTIGSASIAVGGAGAGGGLGLNAPGFGPKVQHFSGGRAMAGSKKAVEVSADVVATWQQVLDDKDPMAYVYCTYSPDGKSLELAAQGTGGLKDFKAELGDNIAWGGFRCYGVDKRGGVECKRAKFIFVQHKPENASAMKKAKQGSHRGDVKEALYGTHLDIAVESLEDLSEQTIISKLQAAAGAHKPNGYEFDEGVFLEADYYGLGIGKDCKGETSKN